MVAINGKPDLVRTSRFCSERPEADVRPGRCRECLGAPKRCRTHDGCVLRGLHNTARSLNVQPVRGSNASSPAYGLRATLSAGGFHIEGGKAIVNVFERNGG